MVGQRYGMLERKQAGHQRHQRQAVGPVLVALAPLVHHHLALGLEPFRGQRGQQIAHAIRLHPQRPVQRARRHHLPVVGPVGVGGSVQLRAGLLQRREVALVVVLRSLEHQVLEEMREPGHAWPFVLRTDVVPDVDGDDRHAVVLVHDDVEAVGQLAPGERQIQRRNRGAHRTWIKGMRPLLASAALWAATATCDAVRWATCANARPAGDPGSLTTSGTPESPPSRIG